ncbi:hypothetical protein RUND412_008267 [Rhizina undulata]
MYNSRAYASHRSRTPSPPSSSEHRESGFDGDYESDDEFHPARGRSIPSYGYTEKRRFVVLNNDLHRGTRITMAIQRDQPPRNPSLVSLRPYSRHENINQYGYRTDLPLHGRPNYDSRSAIPDNDMDFVPPPASQQFHSRHNFYRYVPNPFPRAHPHSRSRPVTPGDEHRLAPPGSPPPVRRYYGPFGRRLDSPPPPATTSWNPPRFPPNVYSHHDPYGHELRRRLARGPGERSRPIFPDSPNTRNALDSGSDSGSDSDYSRLQRTASNRVRAWATDQARRAENSGGRF